MMFYELLPRNSRWTHFNMSSCYGLGLPTANNADELCRVSGGNAKYTTFGLNNFKLSIFVKEFLHVYVNQLF